MRPEINDSDDSYPLSLIKRGEQDEDCPPSSLPPTWHRKPSMEHGLELFLTAVAILIVGIVLWRIFR